jgi:hypothetical protein
VVADLYNMAVINYKSFKGHEMPLGVLSKSQQYTLATGEVTNFYKSEEVLCRRWHNLAPNLGIEVAKSSKYLGVITGYNSSMAQKAIAEQEACIYKQIDTWDHKLSSSPIDKVMVAKIMYLSIACQMSNKQIFAKFISFTELPEIRE